MCSKIFLWNQNCINKADTWPQLPLFWLLHPASPARLLSCEDRWSTTCSAAVPWIFWYRYRIYSWISGSCCRSLLSFILAIKVEYSKYSAAAKCSDTWTQSSIFPLYLICSVAFMQKHSCQLSQRKCKWWSKRVRKGYFFFFKTFHQHFKIKVYLKIPHLLTSLNELSV